MGQPALLAEEEIDGIVERWKREQRCARGKGGDGNIDDDGHDGDGSNGDGGFTIGNINTLDDVNRILRNATRARIIQQGGDPSTAPESFNQSSLRNYFVLFKSKLNHFYVGEG